MNIKKTMSVVLLSSVILTSVMPSVMAAEVANDDSTVSAKVKTGGMKVVASDVDLGKLVIGENIDPVTGEVIVTDHTGGDGWKLQVKSTNFDVINPSLVESVKVGEGEKSFITNEDVLVNKGKSLLEDQKYNADYSATWGVKPEVGNKTNELTWTLTPEIEEKTIADNFMEDLSVGFTEDPNMMGLFNMATDKRKDPDTGIVIHQGWNSKVDKNGEINFLIDVSEYSFAKENEYRDGLVGYKNEVKEEQEAFGITDINYDGDLEWIFTGFHHLGFDSPYLKDNNFFELKASGIDNKLNDDGTFTWGEDMLERSLFTTTSNHDSLSRTIIIPFKDGSQAKLKVNLKFTGLPTQDDNAKLS